MAASPPDRMKILIAEDSATTRTALAGMLTSWGYDVHEVPNGAQAWDAFDHQSFPIVLTDWQMPDVDGIELIRRIREKEDTGIVYTILLTARSATEDVVSAMGQGADAYLVKPADPDELRARIQAGVRIVQLEQRLERRHQQLVEARTQILESEKLAGIGRLAAGMAHEVNNPIAVVSGNIDIYDRGIRSLLAVLEHWEAAAPRLIETCPDLLQEIQQLTEEHDLDWVRETLPRYIDSTRSHLQRVRDIVLRLQDFSWHDKALLDQIDPRQAVRTTIDVLASELARAKVDVVTGLQEVSPLTCHPARFNQAVYNVLHNAIQASSAGDSVEITVFEEDQSVVIRIADRGPGIPEQYRSQIFQPFFTTRNVGAGYGLGLSFSQRVCREAGGDISCSPREGGGTVFDIRIPVAEPNGSH